MQRRTGREQSTHLKREPDHENLSRGLAYAPNADLVWCETAKPDLDEARRFAEAIEKEYPDQLLSYNCSASFNWKQNLNDATIAKFQRELSAMGYTLWRTSRKWAPATSST
jgi:isocitrate lyase